MNKKPKMASYFYNCGNLNVISANLFDVYGDVDNISINTIESVNIDKDSIISNTPFKYLDTMTFTTADISHCLFENGIENNSQISGMHNDTIFSTKLDGVTLDKINFDNCLVGIPYLTNLEQPAAPITLSNRNINKGFISVSVSSNIFFVIINAYKKVKVCILNDGNFLPS